MDRRLSVSDLDDQDESVRIAVRALGDMRRNSRSDASRTPSSLSVASSSSSPPAATSASSPPPQSPPPPDAQPKASPSSPAFVTRMSHFPLVGSALRAYEQGKASSRVVKYGAEIVESSVMTISRPVIDRLPVNVNQLDEFACRQLDRLDKYRRPSTEEPPPSSPTSHMPVLVESSTFEEERGRPKLKMKTLNGSPVDDRGLKEGLEASSSLARRRGWKEGGERGVPSWLESTSPYTAQAPASGSRSSTPTQNGDEARSHQTTSSETRTETQVAQRSRWQAVLLEAGGLSAALSEESMRRLKYCLQWLQYATAHIDAQILILRDFTAALQPFLDSSSLRRPNPISEEHMRKLTVVRRDIVHTIRQVVDVVSQYAGTALPEPARNRVRGFILKLPQRWASKAAAVVPNVVNVVGERETVAAASGSGAVRRGANRRAALRERGTGGPESGQKSGPPSRATSPHSSPRLARAPLNRHGETPETGGGADARSVSHGAALVAAQRILTLATESLDMMRGVTGVVKDSLDRADAWVGRLRTVGIQRGVQEGEDTEGYEFEFGHRRKDSSQYDDQDLQSPFFSSSSTAWGSSIPSTPGGGPYNAPSPGAIPIGAMSIGSRYNTPRSSVVGLPDEDRDDMTVETLASKRTDSGVWKAGDIKVAGIDAASDEDGEKGSQKMDVDV